MDCIAYWEMLKIPQFLSIFSTSFLIIEQSHVEKDIIHEI